MNRKIAFLRGINVGGKKIIRSIELQALCDKLGYKEVKTYLQSGNIVFNYTGKNMDLEKGFEQAIFLKFGFNVPVIIKDAKELKDAIKQNPFFNKELDLKKMYLCFLKTKPSDKSIQEIQTYQNTADKFEIRNNYVFLCYQGKYSQSKLTNNFLEKKLKVTATTRNWKTVLKLQELSQ